MESTTKEQAPAGERASERLLLDALQARLLGCLIEKEATTPDTYPLTVNAAQAAANQKTARDPVMQLSPGQAHHALRELEQLGLARQHFSSRAERYAHRANEALDLTRQQTVLLGLLLLRGPQTVHELLARSDRMVSFDDADDVKYQLERMTQRETALVVLLPRASGQREDRYMHLLCGGVAESQPDRRPPDAATRPTAGTRTEASTDTGLEARIDALALEVAGLRARLEALEGRGAG